MVFQKLPRRLPVQTRPGARSPQKPVRSEGDRKSPAVGGRHAPGTLSGEGLREPPAREGARSQGSDRAAGRPSCRESEGRETGVSSPGASRLPHRARGPPAESWAQLWRRAPRGAHCRGRRKDASREPRPASHFPPPGPRAACPGALPSEARRREGPPREASRAPEVVMPRRRGRKWLRPAAAGGRGGATGSGAA